MIFSWGQALDTRENDRELHDIITMDVIVTINEPPERGKATWK